MKQFNKLSILIVSVLVTSVATVDLCCAYIANTGEDVLAGLDFVPYDVAEGCTPLEESCELLPVTCKTSSADNVLGFNCGPIVPSSNGATKQLLSELGYVGSPPFGIAPGCIDFGVTWKDSQLIQSELAAFQPSFCPEIPPNSISGMLVVSSSPLASALHLHLERIPDTPLHAVLHWIERQSINLQYRSTYTANGRSRSGQLERSCGPRAMPSWYQVSHSWISAERANGSSMDPAFLETSWRASLPTGCRIRW
ncbi:hypothetical protein C8R45DRAFT_927718 [Mycena sanguinolenta]|nr:hypothetical protein C8R45DRAFT_927718 [Mycena sanguinolenta]